MNDKIYRATWTGHFRQAWPILLYASLLVIVPMYVHHVFGISNLRFAVISTAAFLSPVIFAHLLIHLRYGFVTAGLSVTFSGDEETITIRSSRNTRIIRVNEIQSVDLLVPRSLARDELFVYPWQTYGYAIMNLKSREKFLITSLVIPRMKFPIDLPNTNIQECLYCWPPTPSSLSR